MAFFSSSGEMEEMLIEFDVIWRHVTMTLDFSFQRFESMTQSEVEVADCDFETTRRYHL